MGTRRLIGHRRADDFREVKKVGFNSGNLVRCCGLEVPRSCSGVIVGWFGRSTKNFYQLLIIKDPLQRLKPRFGISGNMVEDKRRALRCSEAFADPVSGNKTNDQVVAIVISDLQSRDFGHVLHGNTEQAKLVLPLPQIGRIHNARLGKEAYRFKYGTVGVLKIAGEGI